VTTTEEDSEVEEDPQTTKVLVVVDGLAVLELLKTPLVEQEDHTLIPVLVVVDKTVVVKPQHMVYLI
jgi:hypothetical protein